MLVLWVYIFNLKEEKKVKKEQERGIREREKTNAKGIHCSWLKKLVCVCLYLKDYIVDINFFVLFLFVCMCVCVVLFCVVLCYA